MKQYSAIIMSITIVCELMPTCFSYFDPEKKEWVIKTVKHENDAYQKKLDAIHEVRALRKKYPNALKKWPQNYFGKYYIEEFYTTGFIEQIVDISTYILRLHTWCKKNQNKGYCWNMLPKKSILKDSQCIEDIYIILLHHHIFKIE